MRRGFTLIEMLAYIGLLTTLLVMVGSAEHSIRLGVSAQNVRLSTQEQALAIGGAGLTGSLQADIRQAHAIDSVRHDALLLGNGAGEARQWSFADGVLSRDGKPVARHLESFQFAQLDGGVRFSGVVSREEGGMQHRHHVTGWAAPRRSP